ncbi:hypothetical protein MBEHAL_2107 [Halarchaeum acidiphilum MH1-52-1]|uniref:Uncharacterized protein n=1 Tax=Halarchaeum acidiphilum MH1-52-1 TaxID=1261545 RepID=U2YX56_9EURY|nr:hypothetical protein [Halarchaeum acidiphilum]GAD53347.1 hypothetical protein MBEHAL_2107 [Halarchaeum acidiphilum MH1-52-1]
MTIVESDSSQRREDDGDDDDRPGLPETGGGVRGERNPGKRPD